MEVKKIKDWLKERSEKQFELLPKQKGAYRLKDGRTFWEGQQVNYNDNYYYFILFFHPDKIHVQIREQFGSSAGISVEINELVMIFIADEDD